MARTFTASTPPAWMLSIFAVIFFITADLASGSSTSSSYGVDCSFPIHHHKETFVQNHADHSNGCEGLAHRIGFFDEYMDGCRKHYDGEECQFFDDTIIYRNFHQPQSMVNFTDTGYKKIPGNDNFKSLLTDFWNANQDKAKPERWEYADIHTNHWKVPTEMASIYDRELGGGLEFRDAVLQAVQPLIEEWTGMKQLSSSVYGVRVYRDGAVLMSHCDRLPLVSSAIVNVAQDVDEDWPLEVYGRDGKAVNITMSPGDIVLYESGSLIHGRPFPLKGRYYANIFIHFAPYGFMNGEPFVNKDDPEIPPFLVAGSPSANLMKQGEGDELSVDIHMAAQSNDIKSLKLARVFQPSSLNEEDENGWQPIHVVVRAGHIDIVQFLLENSVDYNAPTPHNGWPLDVAMQFLGTEHPVTNLLIEYGAKNQPQPGEAHWAASSNDLAKLEEVAKHDPDELHRNDQNGWQPIHEAIRAGHTESVRFLLDNGADYNARTFHGEGATPLSLALEHHGHDHPIVDLLKALGAESIAANWESSTNRLRGFASTEVHDET